MKYDVDGNDEDMFYDAAASRAVKRGQMPTTIKFTHMGQEFNMTKEDFVKPLKGVKPGNIQKYSTNVGGVQYPIRQVVAVGTGKPAIEFTSAAAYRILRRFGFNILTKE